jgi:hypothetical protein
MPEHHRGESKSAKSWASIPRPPDKQWSVTIGKWAWCNSAASQSSSALTGEGGEMAGFLCLDELFEGRHFDREVIALCVRWYLRFKPSFRDLVEMMSERNLSMAHTTISAGCIIMRRTSSAA